MKRIFDIAVCVIAVIVLIMFPSISKELMRLDGYYEDNEK